jgi:hypothetical protein
MVARINMHGLTVVHGIIQRFLNARAFVLNPLKFWKVLRVIPEVIAKQQI